MIGEKLTMYPNHRGPASPRRAGGGRHGHAPPAEDGLDARAGAGQGGHRHPPAAHARGQAGHEGAAGQGRGQSQQQGIETAPGDSRAGRGAAGRGRQAPRLAAGRVLLQAEAGPARVQLVLRVRPRPQEELPLQGESGRNRIPARCCQRQQEASEGRRRTTGVTETWHPNMINVNHIFLYVHRVYKSSIVILS